MFALHSSSGSTHELPEFIDELAGAHHRFSSWLQWCMKDLGMFRGLFWKPLKIQVAPLPPSIPCALFSNSRLEPSRLKIPIRVGNTWSSPQISPPARTTASRFDNGLLLLVIQDLAQAHALFAFDHSWPETWYTMYSTPHLGLCPHNS